MRDRMSTARQNLSRRRISGAFPSASRRLPTDMVTGTSLALPQARTCGGRLPAHALRWNARRAWRAVVKTESVSSAAAEAREGRPSAIITTSPRMAEILSLVARVAAGDAKVLITGESGVGKDLIARDDPRALAARAARLRRGQLRGPHRDAPRIGAVRPREGQLHRRRTATSRASCSSRTAARSSSTKSAR